MNHQEELLKAFHIGIEDIQANRTGRLGPTQQRNLLNSGNGNLAGSLLIGLLLAAILYGVANKPLVTVQWITALILFAIVLIIGMRYFLQTRAAVADGRVECLVGQVQVRSRGKAGWYLTVAGRSFQLPIRPWNVQRDTIYRVYIVPGTRSIVAIEQS
jgi:hypothetical protein